MWPLAPSTNCGLPADEPRGPVGRAPGHDVVLLRGQDIGRHVDLAEVHRLSADRQAVRARAGCSPGTCCAGTRRTSARAGWSRRRSSTAGRRRGRLALEVVVDDVGPDQVVGAQRLEHEPELGALVDAATADRHLALQHALFVDEDTQVAGFLEVEHGRQQGQARHACRRRGRAATRASRDRVPPTHQPTTFTWSALLTVCATSMAFITPSST